MCLVCVVSEELHKVTAQGLSSLRVKFDRKAVAKPCPLQPEGLASGTRTDLDDLKRLYRLDGRHCDLPPGTPGSPQNWRCCCIRLK
ncbi:protein of unknown function [Streptomyces sp. KY75]|nr:protein of unknown function [Streptomyces sp. KY75]CAD5983056.1 protein of unknown function [Streptomyces sp. KY70]